MDDFAENMPPEDREVSALSLPPHSMEAEQSVLGGLLLGLIELMTIAFLPELTGYKDAFAFVLLIVVLLVKPTGLLGSKQGEKV